MASQTKLVAKGHVLMSNDRSLDIAKTKGVCGVYREDVNATHAIKTPG